jgi:hypothetical protein
MVRPRDPFIFLYGGGAIVIQECACGEQIEVGGVGTPRPWDMRGERVEGRERRSSRPSSTFFDAEDLQEAVLELKRRRKQDAATIQILRTSVQRYGCARLSFAGDGCSMNTSIKDC